MAKNTPGIVVTGASGRMGRIVIQLLTQSSQARLAGAIVRPGHPWVGQDVGVAMGGAPVGVCVASDPIEPIASAQAIIDFTTPKATLNFAKLAGQSGTVHVIGTTGMTDEEVTALTFLARRSVQIHARNTSLGINLLTQLTKIVAKIMGEEVDIHITEKHHKHKVDAPSGTAWMLGEAAAEGRGVPLADMLGHGWNHTRGAHKPGPMMHCSSIRAADIVCEHDVLFATTGERITLSHVASDRTVFARGAIKAALWGMSKSPGQYNMADVFGLELRKNPRSADTAQDMEHGDTRPLKTSFG
ncbi:MAG: 4-hydroxy-tetrahydrodipicolinate reductase [Rhodobacteraceae bacterium]|nr:4-hydroxy-tetrahydrodipicolinate reductase [Paracoccaceae bacterium]